MLNVVKFSSNCSFFVAPKITVLTLGFIKQYPKDNWVKEIFNFSATGSKAFIFQFSEWFHPTQISPNFPGDDIPFLYSF